MLEIVEDHQGDACRTAYTMHRTQVAYVLYAFQKMHKVRSRTNKI